MSSQGAAKRRAAQATDKPAKRTRVSRACDQCRIAREKCDGTQPTCSTCSTCRRACTYTATVKKRGIQPGYIRALELALAYLFQHDPENETLINEKLAHGGQSSLLLSRDSKESNKLHKRWRKARFYTDVDKILSGGEPSRREPSEEPSSASDDERSITEGPSLKSRTQTRVSRQARDQHLPSESMGQSAGTIVQQAATDNAHVSLPLDSWKLLDIYFTFTQSWLPICEKYDILKLSYTYPAGGLVLSPEVPDAGAHAELWSILAVASVQDSNNLTPDVHHNQSSMTPTKLYARTRSLIPDEAGRFEFGHVKAILNLAVFNMAQSSMQAAWLLVASASRILELVDQALLAINPRHKHVLYGCFVLDSMLATHFDRRPYFRAEDIRRPSNIDEDGLDEWQPWTGQSYLSSGQQSRTPLLTLSTLNAMIDITTLLSNDQRTTQDKLHYLKAWEASLPAKLAHICATTPPRSLTPPVILLRLTYHCTALVLTSSQSWLLRSLNLLEQAQDEIGWKSLPPVLRCLLTVIDRFSTSISSSHEIQSRLRRLEAAMSTAWPSSCGHRAQQHASAPHTNPRTPLVTSTQVATPLSIVPSSQRVTLGTKSPPALSPFDPALAEPLPLESQPLHDNAPQGAFRPNLGDARFPEPPNDLESFFDELASLDTMNNLDTQPQFMQNLGFAPDANMADLFSEYIPMQSSAFAGQEAEGVNLDHYGFYDGS